MIFLGNLAVFVFKKKPKKLFLSFKYSENSTADFSYRKDF
jgi:hypothetical protein